MLQGLLYVKPCTRMENKHLLRKADMIGQGHGGMVKHVKAVFFSALRNGSIPVPVVKDDLRRRDAFRIKKAQPRGVALHRRSHYLYQTVGTAGLVFNKGLGQIQGIADAFEF